MGGAQGLLHEWYVDRCCGGGGGVVVVCWGWGCVLAMELCGGYGAVLQGNPSVLLGCNYIDVAMRSLLFCCEYVQNSAGSRE